MVKNTEIPQLVEASKPYFSAKVKSGTTKITDIKGKKGFCLDLPKGDEQALLQLRVQPQQLGRLLEIPTGRSQCIHLVL